MTLLDDLRVIASPESVDTARLFNANNVRTYGNPVHSYYVEIQTMYNMRKRLFCIVFSGRNESYLGPEMVQNAVSVLFQHYESLYRHCQSDMMQALTNNRHSLPTSIEIFKINVTISSNLVEFHTTVSDNYYRQTYHFPTRVVPSSVPVEAEMTQYGSTKRGRDNDDDDGYDRDRRVGGSSTRNRNKNRNINGNKKRKSKCKSKFKSKSKSKSKSKYNRKKQTNS